MPFLTDAQRESLLAAERVYMLRLGYHPETRDGLYVSTIDRHSGTIIEGVQGSGKSGLLQRIAFQDICMEQALITLDPHGDLVDDIVAQAPQDMLPRIHVLDMADEEHPFGVNLFAVGQLRTSIAQAQSVDRITHVFDTLWPEVASQQYLPRYLRACILTLLSRPGSNLPDMYRLLVNDHFRQALLAKVTDQTLLSFWQLQYEDLAVPARMQRVGPLIGRLESILMGRPIVRNIVSQRQTSINFRRAIERREILLIKLPVKTLAQDARLIGTILVSQIHAAIFSFANVPLEQRPGVSLIVDEFQNFTTPDFGQFFTEARKYKVMLTIAHQYRNQLPSYLQDSTATARTKVCFQLTPDDASEMAYFYLTGETEIKPEDIDPHPVAHLLSYGSDAEEVQTFIDWYLRPLQRQRKGGSVEIAAPGLRTEHIPYWLLGVKPPTDKPQVADPTQSLDHLLYQAMRTGQEGLPIPIEVVYGFSNCGRGFYAAFRRALNKEKLLSFNIEFPGYLAVPTAQGWLRWTRPPEGDKEQLYHFLFHLRSTISHLAFNPIGKKSTTSSTEVAHMLTQLPRRAAFVRSGEDVGVIYTDNTPPALDAVSLSRRLSLIRDQTRAKYCRPKDQVETDEENGPDDEPPLPSWEDVEP